MNSRWRAVRYFVLTALITAALTCAITVIIVNQNRKDTVVLSTDEYNELRELFVFEDVLDEIEARNFETAPPRESLINAGLKGIVNELHDPYAQYYTAGEYEEYLTRMNGEYNGIGLLVGQPDEVGAPVLDVYEDNAADKAGVQAGDVITKVDGVLVANIEFDDLLTMVNGEVGTIVKLSLLRGKENIEVEVERSNVNIKRVHRAFFREATGYIRIDMFTGNCAEEFSEAIRYLTDRGMRSLVIDLRNNPGGSLDTVIDVADTLLGKCRIVTVRGRDVTDEEVYNGSGKGVNIPLAIIVNEHSASASEILAGAVQDNEKGAIVGVTTYGKGIVQTTFRLNASGGWLKLTTAAYYTPNGRNIHGLGIVPDIEVDLSEALKEIPVSELPQDDDAQLWAALDYVRELADTD